MELKDGTFAFVTPSISLGNLNDQPILQTHSVDATYKKRNEWCAAEVKRVWLPGCATFSGVTPKAGEDVRVEGHTPHTHRDRPRPRTQDPRTPGPQDHQDTRDHSQSSGHWGLSTWRAVHLVARQDHLH